MIFKIYVRSKDGEDGDERLAKVKHPKAKKGANSKTNGR